MTGATGNTPGPSDPRAPHVERRRAIDPSLLRRLLLAAFITFALVLFVGTHGPGLRVESDVIERPDIFVHFALFAAWTILFFASGLPLRVAQTIGLSNPGARVYFVGWCAAVLYAAFDEATQAIPWINRTAAWDDFGADALGVTVGTLVWAVLLRRLLTRFSPGAAALIQTAPARPIPHTGSTT